MKKMNIFYNFKIIAIIFYCSNINSSFLYLDLMKKCVLNMIYEDPGLWNPFDAEKREKGQDWPSMAHTMIGLDGLNNIQFCLEDVIKNNVPGDCIETGVWRGGAVIFMRAILQAHNVTDRVVWVADSFQGLPRLNSAQYPADQGELNDHANQLLAIPLETVKANFAKYGLLDEQVKFLPGWFKDTLPQAPIQKLALLRLDGDIYESTINALDSLYPKLSVGGYIIIDDYVAMPSCKKAVDDYRKAHNIAETIEIAGWSVVYWKKTE